MSSEDIQSKKLVEFYLRSVICIGGLTYILAAYRLDLKIVDLKLGVLVVITGLLSSRMTIKLPQFGSWISVSDTFIFLTLLLYGCEAAILMAATEAFLSSIRSAYCRKWSTILFNWASAAVATDSQIRHCYRPYGAHPIRDKLRRGGGSGRVKSKRSNLVDMEEALPLDVDHLFCWRLCSCRYRNTDGAIWLLRANNHVADHCHCLLHLSHLPEEYRSLNESGGPG